MEENYQICTNCIMDTSDINISFDDQGVCDNCHSFYEVIKPVWIPDERGTKYLNNEFSKVKKDGKAEILIALLG